MTENSDMLYSPFLTSSGRQSRSASVSDAIAFSVVALLVGGPGCSDGSSLNPSVSGLSVAGTAPRLGVASRVSAAGVVVTCSTLCSIVGCTVAAHLGLCSACRPASAGGQYLRPVTGQ